MNHVSFTEAYNRALKSCSDNDTQAASVYIKKALEIDPTHCDANHLQGVILSHSGHCLEALPYFEKALVKCRKATYYKNYASALIEVARSTTAGKANEYFSKALDALDVSIELNPEDTQAQKNRKAIQSLLRG